VCGRYSLAAPNPAKVRERFGLGDDVSLAPRFNIAPGQDVVAVATDREGAPRPDLLRWGLVPHWAKAPDSGYKMINARAETIAERPAFRDALQGRRCLIVADGFYEWQPRTHGPRQPWWITRADHEPFAFAGLWATWRPDSQSAPLRTCTIITTSANDALRDIHDRMPVILCAESEAAWLDAGAGADALRDLLQPLADDQVARIPVSTVVNGVRNDGPECVMEVDLQPDAPREGSLF